MQNKKKINKYIVSSDSDIETILNKFTLNRCRAALILKKNKIIGTISEGDIVRGLMQGISLQAPVKKYMNTNFKFLRNENSKKINKLIIKYNISLIPICDKNMSLKKIVVVNEYLNKILKK